MPTRASEVLDFAEVGRVPALGDNVAIAVRTLAAGTRVLIRQLVFEFSNTVLEGHRFAIYRIRTGEPLLSWGLPFGRAVRDIEPGEYICNEKILRVLKERRVEAELPGAANFIDHRLPFELKEEGFRPGEQVSMVDDGRTFLGFRRDGERGVGTRNYIVVMGTSSRTGAFARAVAGRFRDVARNFRNVDGVVAVDHTEGGGTTKPNNFEVTLRTLAGFMVNPNVGAVLCVDYGNEAVSNAALTRYLEENGYPTRGLLHRFFSIGGSYEKSLEEAAGIVSEWVTRVDEFRREAVPLTHLKIGLQCGGSDAFSGVSANPLAGIMARETVARGGSANLAETDELIGAESYVLTKVRDFATAQAFIEKSRRFQEWAARHGHTAEGNPSGGNMLRGLYNIAIKSIGAARKKDPATRLDYVIDFGERMRAPGFYFMDSPGNDLESIAGQVAAGCNIILFATGNGSITNFPFVPTIKVMTTTRRFELVRNEMDFNAGRYLDGEALEDLGREAFELMVRVGSGDRSAGEKAGHSQVQLWREWRNNSAGANSAESDSEIQFSATHEQVRKAREIVASAGRRQIALVLPTSLCAGQIASGITEKLNRMGGAFDRAVALPHTEGCGNSGGESERLFMRTMAGYLAHPFVARGLLLEHGCEKTHNDAFRKVLRELAMPETNYAFQSVQLDGGIERVTEKCLAWFREQGRDSETERKRSFSGIGLHGRAMPENVRAAFGMLNSAFAEAGSAVVRTFGAGDELDYGERIQEPKEFRMRCPTDDDLEIITGLCGTGIQVAVLFVSGTMVAGNPMVPTIRVGFGGEVDATVKEEDSAESIFEAILKVLERVLLEKQKTAAERVGDLGFQITRGYEGISL
ncbi:MAG TPA: UxaA family hydrolase [Verrucomicrobiae bacterium]